MQFLSVQTITFLFLALPSALAKVGGPCAPPYNSENDCICYDKARCESMLGYTIVGSPGNWPCPDDPSNVVGCKKVGCDPNGRGSYCAFGCKPGFSKISGKDPNITPS